MTELLNRIVIPKGLIWLVGFLLLVGFFSLVDASNARNDANLHPIQGPPTTTIDVGGQTVTCPVGAEYGPACTVSGP
jgi:hypothetical protein